MDGDLEIGATDDTSRTTTRLDRASTFAALAEHHLDEAYRLARLGLADRRGPLAAEQVVSKGMGPRMPEPA
jgi:hypothetical protein